MADDYNKIYVSYSWTAEADHPTVDQLQTWCKENNSPFELIREKDRLGYAERISEFMSYIANNWFVIAIISKPYMESEYCMHELLETYKKGDFYNRVLLIKVGEYWPDKDNYHTLKKYWQVKAGLFTTDDIGDSAKRVKAINDGLMALLNALNDINTNTRSTDENAVYKSIENFIKEKQTEEKEREKRYQSIKLYKVNAKEEIRKILSNTLIEGKLESRLISKNISGCNVENPDMIDCLCAMKVRTAISILFDIVNEYSVQTRTGISTEVELHDLWGKVSEIVGWLVFFAIDEEKLRNMPIQLQNRNMLCYQIPVKDEISAEVFAALYHGNKASFKGDINKPRSTRGAHNINHIMPSDGWGLNAIDVAKKALWKYVYKEPHIGEFNTEDNEELNDYLKWNRNSGDRKTIYFSINVMDKTNFLNKPENYRMLLNEKNLPDLILILKEPTKDNTIFLQPEISLLNPIRGLIAETLKVEHTSLQRIKNK